MEMETDELSSGELRERMRAARVRVADLAAAAKMQQSSFSAILTGRAYCGEARRQRIEAAIIRLGLDKPAAPVAPPTFRIRQL